MYIKARLPDFDSYAGCCQIADVTAFVARHGYTELYRDKFAERADGGTYFDIVYKRQP